MANKLLGVPIGKYQNTTMQTSEPDASIRPWRLSGTAMRLAFNGYYLLMLHI